MPLPATLKCGPYRYTVTADPAAYAKKSKDDGHSECIGYCEPDALRITLCPDNAPDVMRECLLHEVLHAVIHLSLHGSGQKLTEEDYIERTSAGLLATLQNNPAFAAFLLEPD